MNPSREVRCPGCATRARLLGKARGHHADCTAEIQIKCGKCGELVLVPLDPAIHPYIERS